MISDHFDRIFILHLPRTVKRRVLVLCQTAFLKSSKAEIVPATDGRTLDLDDMKSRGILRRDTHLQRDLTKGEVACYLGHVGIWRSLLRACMAGLRRKLRIGVLCSYGMRSPVPH